MRNLLRNKRKSLDFTLEDMSKRLNVTITQVAYYEKGKKYPRANDIWKIKEAYQLSDEELLAWLKYIHEKKGDK